jgi:hypothetical protein
MDDPDLDPIDETAKPDLSDSELSDVDEEAFAGIDTSRIGLESDDEGPNVFALKPAKRKAGTGERRKKRDEGTTEERRRKRQERLRKGESKRKASVPDDIPDLPDPSQRPEDPEAARRWDLDQSMEAAIARKPVKRRKRDDEIVSYFSGRWLT